MYIELHHAIKSDKKRKTDNYTWQSEPEFMRHTRNN